jgi:uncharacterized Tic20 family protein
MRQGGLRPHNHNSGVYWVRAAGGKNINKVKSETKKLDNFSITFTFFVLFVFIVTAICIVSKMTWIFAITLLLIWFSFFALWVYVIYLSIK